MPIFRLYVANELVGVVGAANKKLAEAYGIGAYGAGCSADRVAVKEAIENVGICVVLQTAVKHVHGDRDVRIVAP